jgi:hypothetical protein
MAVFRELAAGRQPGTITRAGLAEMNAADAAAWADCDRDETLALLRDYADTAAAEVRGWDDAQLARQGVYVVSIATENSPETPKWNSPARAFGVGVSPPSVRRSGRGRRPPGASRGGDNSAPGC